MKPGSKRSKRTIPLDSVSVAGFKSIRESTEIQLKPLTIFSGANSSGKSSIIQPLLLLKQTLEISYDPGPLFLNGRNARFTSMAQLLWHGKRKQDRAKEFKVSLRRGNYVVESCFRHEGKTIQLVYTAFGTPDRLVKLEQSTGRGELLRVMDAVRRGLPRMPDSFLKGKFEVRRDRCAMAIYAQPLSQRKATTANWYQLWNPFGSFDTMLRNIIHLPGLRGHAQRDYPVTQVGGTFEGVFQEYSASIIASWQANQDPRLERLNASLKRLGLTWKVEARPVDETRVELRVGRLLTSKQGGAKDLVSLADVGVGLTQVLPVIVAILAADPGQIVYLEEPEIHLHPRAQVELAALLLEAAERGVQVIVETHSYLLIRSVQQKVAADLFRKELVKLHWFERDQATGITRITSGELDKDGTYGEWPEDFGSVELDLENQFLRDSLRTKKT